MGRKLKEPPLGRSLLPQQVRYLAPCERQLAEIIYRCGPITAREAEERLPRTLSNGAIRSMLLRLCNKGILKRRKVDGSHDPRDRRIPFLYIPAIDASSIRHRAVQKLAGDFFEGSLPMLQETVAEMLSGGREDNHRDRERKAA